MSTNNLISVQFTATEIKQLDTALAAINKVMANKTYTISADERMRYGSIKDNNKKLVDKVKMYMENFPDMLPPMLDRDEFLRDYAAREVLNRQIKLLKNVTDRMEQTKIMLDFDNYNNTITYYRYLRFLASNNAPGAESIYTDLKEHFKRSSSSNSADGNEGNGEATSADSLNL